MTTKHELVINTNDQVHQMRFILSSYSNETSFSPHQRDFSGFSGRERLTLPRDSLMMIESQSSLNHRDLTIKQKHFQCIRNGYPNLEMFKEEEHFKDYKINKISEYIKYLDTEIKDRERLKKNYGKLDKILFVLNVRV